MNSYLIQTQSLPLNLRVVKLFVSTVRRTSVEAEADRSGLGNPPPTEPPTEPSAQRVTLELTCGYIQTRRLPGASPEKDALEKQ